MLSMSIDQKISLNKFVTDKDIHEQKMKDKVKHNSPKVLTYWKDYQKDI